MEASAASSRSLTISWRERKREGREREPRYTIRLGALKQDTRFVTRARQHKQKTKIKKIKNKREGEIFTWRRETGKREPELLQKLFFLSFLFVCVCCPARWIVHSNVHAVWQCTVLYIRSVSLPILSSAIRFFSRSVRNATLVTSNILTCFSPSSPSSFSPSLQMLCRHTDHPLRPDYISPFFLFPRMHFL